MPISEALRYPIGRFAAADAAAEDVARWTAELEALPGQLAAAVAGLTAAQLDTPYRPGGWTVRQVVHHLADSHTHAYVRFKWALTEEAPAVRPYDEAAWAVLPDVQVVPVDVSLAYLDALHRRWVLLIRALPPTAFERAYHHLEDGLTPLALALGRYAWHGRHHLAHITRLAEREGWRSPDSIASTP